MAKYKVVEKFVSVNGEGVLAGQLAVFIRFHGCNLQCAYCDTAWANLEDAPYTQMDEQEIYNYVKETGVTNVTLTGGEPMLVPDLDQLLRLFGEDSKLNVEIETNGSIDLSSFIGCDYRPALTMDYKLAGSGMESEMLVSNFGVLMKKDTVKFVVMDREDLDRTRELIGKYDLVSKCHVYISTVFGAISLDQVVEYMKEHHMNGVTLQLQMHKIIWPPELRGV